MYILPITPFGNASLLAELEHLFPGFLILSKIVKWRKWLRKQNLRDFFEQEWGSQVIFSSSGLVVFLVSGCLIPLMMSIP